MDLNGWKVDLGEDVDQQFNYSRWNFSLLEAQVGPVFGGFWLRRGVKT